MAQNELTSKQREVAEFLSNPECSENRTQIMKKCNVSRTTFYRWIRENDNFTKYVDELIDKYTDSETGAVWKALIKRCKCGDIQAIKLFFELKGKYKQDITIKGTGVVTIIDDISGDLNDKTE